MHAVAKTIVQYPELISSAYLPFQSDTLDDALTAMHMRALTAFDTASLQEQESMRMEKLRKLIRSAKKLPLWHELLHTVSDDSISSISDISLLPVTRKETYRSTSFEARTNMSLARRFGVQTTTSGSTGEPLQFNIDGRLKLRQRALLARANGLESFSITHMVNLWPTHNPNPLFGKVFFSARTQDALWDERHRLYEYVKQPGCILHGFSSYFRLLLDFAERDGVSLRPRAIITSGEALSVEVETMLGERFQCPVTNYLGSREFSIMAGRCREGRYHLQSQDLILEVLDGEGRAVATENSGLLTFTGLNSHIAPFIRYQNGDYGMLFSSSCPCGNAQPSFAFVGRADDAVPIPLRDGSHIMPYRFTGIFNTRYEKVRQYQVLHHGPQAFTLRIVPTAAFTDVIADDIVAAFKALVQSDAVTLELMERIPSDGPKVLPYKRTFQ